MHKDRLRPCILHHLLIHLIRKQILDPLCPYLIRLAHRHPYIRIDHICTLCRLLNILFQPNHRARLLGNLLASLHQLLRRPIFLRCTSRKIHPHLRTAHHPGISHIITGIPHIDHLHFQRPKMFPNRQKVCQDLCRMKFIRQPIPHRHLCMFCQLLHNLLSKAPVLNPLIHPAQHSRRIRNTLFLPNLRPRRLQIRRPHPQIMSRHLKRTPRPRTRLLKNQRHILPPKRIHQDPFPFLPLKLRRQIQQILHLLRRKIQQL